MKILAIVPTYNEEKRIVSTVNALKSLPEISKVIVADDGSQDQTFTEAKKATQYVISHKKNFGKGGSINKTLESLDINGVSGVIFADGDLGESAKEFAYLIRAFNKGNDMLIAGFGPPTKKGGFGLVKGLSNWAIKRYGGQKMQTPLSGQRLLSKELVKKLKPFASGFGLEVDMTIRALRAGFKVKEVPTKMSHDETGRDLASFVHRGRQFFDILKVTLRRKK